MTFNFQLSTFNLVVDYLKIGKATELSGRDRKIYRALEILPGAFSWLTLLLLVVFSYFQPVWVAYFIIAFDVYWLLLVIYLGIHLLAAYRELKRNMRTDWMKKCNDLSQEKLSSTCLASQGMRWQDLYHLIILPTYNESIEIIRTALDSLLADGYPPEYMIVVLAVEERAGESAKEKANQMRQEFGDKFRNFIVTLHPDGIIGELKGKGANQAWAAKIVRAEVIDKEALPYEKILVSVFDIDTIVHPGYFSRLTYMFLTVENPYRASYQPVPVYHNNIWEAPWFARVAANSNTFWQMMQQIRHEQLATYSSHSMTWQALVDINFWSTSMVSEDSRIFWHCLLYYDGDYRVEPMHFPVSMDATMDKTAWLTARNLYKQQRRWGWGIENVPYLIFNTWKRRKKVKIGKLIGNIAVQVYGFHSWATNALIIAVVGWLPMMLGGDRFNVTVLSGNLPIVTRFLMTIAMVGMVVSAIVSNLLLPRRPKKYPFHKRLQMIVQWVFIPVTIIIFGSFPGLESQTRLMLGKYMGFWVTPKERS